MNEDVSSLIILIYSTDDYWSSHLEKYSKTHYYSSPSQLLSKKEHYFDSSDRLLAHGMTDIGVIG